MVMIGDKIRIVSPVTILAFACELDNKEIAYFGLAEYLGTMRHDDQNVVLRDSNRFHWKSFVNLADDVHSSSKNYMILMMEMARDLDILIDYSIC